MFVEMLKMMVCLCLEESKKIILYGSYARGDYNESSDIDMMMIIKFQLKKQKIK